MSRRLSKSVRHDRTRRDFVSEFCGRGLIAKRAVAIVSQQQVSVACDQEVEIAVVIESTNARTMKDSQASRFLRRRLRRETSFVVVVVERARALAKNEEIGAAVVVIVAGDGCRSGCRRGLRVLLLVP